MATPRYSQVSLDETPWYHVVSRCVRRAYLCGVDYITGQSYEHRREWVEKRIRQLASIFTIDVDTQWTHNRTHTLILTQPSTSARVAAYKPPLSQIPNGTNPWQPRATHKYPSMKHPGIT
jgi:hypothetical protein